MSAILRYLKREEINTGKWDDCVERSPEGLIYARSLYLDTVALNWDALVLNDYEAVMPLPWRKKWGVKYYFKPAFIQQLGLIGNDEDADCAELKKDILRRARYGDVLLNYNNTTIHRSWKAIPHTNMILDLSAGYENIYEKYSDNARRNIIKAAGTSLRYAASSNTALAIKMYRDFYGSRMKSVSQQDYRRFDELCHQLLASQMVFVRTVTHTDGSLLAITLFLTDHKRIYNLMPSVTKEGRKMHANYFLIDQVIKEFSDKDLLLDMEGSDLEGVRNFYRKFGCVDQPYFYYHFNRLPWYIRLFKQ